MSTPRTYRFSDSQRPGLLLGLSGRQAVPVATGRIATSRSKIALAAAVRRALSASAP